MRRPIVRRATPDDWQQSRTLRLRALADSPDAFSSTLDRELAFDDDVWRTRLQTAATFFAVDPYGTFHGTVTGLAPADEPESREVVAMWVDPDQRGLGIGTDLIEAVIAWARSDGAASIALWVADGNEAARRLYERSGFVDTGERDVIREGLGEARLRRTL